MDRRALNFLFAYMRVSRKCPKYRPKVSSNKDGDDLSRDGKHRQIRGGEETCNNLKQQTIEEENVALNFVFNEMINNKAENMDELKEEDEQENTNHVTCVASDKSLLTDQLLDQKTLEAMDGITNDAFMEESNVENTVKSKEKGQQRSTTSARFANSGKDLETHNLNEFEDKITKLLGETVGSAVEQTKRRIEDTEEKLNNLEKIVDAKISTVVEQTAKGIMALLKPQLSVYEGKLKEHQVSLIELERTNDIRERVSRDFADRCGLRLYELEAAMEECFDQLDMHKPNSSIDEKGLRQNFPFDMPMTSEEIDEVWRETLDDNVMYENAVKFSLGKSDFNAPKPRKKKKRG